MSENESVTIDRARAALIIQDMQNDVMMEGGAFADSGAPEHAKEQNAVENCRRLADACRGAGIPVIHVWYVVEDGSRGLKVNAPLFEGVKETNALVRGSWGAQPESTSPSSSMSGLPPPPPQGWGARLPVCRRRLR